MGEQLDVFRVSLTEIRLYYVFVFISLIYLMLRYRNRISLLYVILIFYIGLFVFIGKNVLDTYRIIITLATMFFLLNYKAIKIIGKYIFPTIWFIFFSISFLYTAYINDDYFTIVFSQYSRYFLFFSFFLIFRKYRNNEIFKKRLEKLLYQLIVIQVLLSVVKLFVMGPTESIVGTIAAQGGALATSFPILAFMFLWLKSNGKLTRNDWFLVLGVLFIGFMSNKRAIWFVMPIFVAAFIYYIPKRRIPAGIAIVSLILIPMTFYLGVRLNRTLNKEHKIWGSFDISYVMDYAKSYTFGEEEGIQRGYGRGGATLLLFDKLKSGNLNTEDWFGTGLRFMYTTSYEEFDELDFGIHSKGAATGFFQTMVSNGFIGIFTFLLFAISIISTTRNTRLRIVLLIFFLWEYFFYTGIVLRDYALSFLFVYIIVFSDKVLIITNARSQLIPVNNVI